MALALSVACADVTRERPNILLVTLDTTRPDRLSCYGYGRETTPNLDRLAAEGILHRRAYAVSSWTLPTHASLFTGKLPTSHGAGFDEEGPLRVVGGPQYPGRDAIRVRPLGQQEVTLAELLRDAGYATGAVLAGPWMKRTFGLDQGFDHYDDGEIPETVGRLAGSVTRAALDWLDVDREGPFFLFLNYYDPHAPYLAPPAFRDHFLPEGVEHADLPREELFNAMYDAEVRYLDHHLGRLCDGLRERGLFDDTWVIVTADHGELLGENDEWGHGNSLRTVELAIPMIVKPPGGEASRIEEHAPLQQTDVLPMIAERLDLRLPPGVQGAARGGGHPVVAELSCFPSELCKGDWVSIVDGDRKYARCESGEETLTDAAADPAETKNLVAESPERAGELARELASFIDSLPRPRGPTGPEQEIDEETRRTLENLGYVGGE